MRIHVLRHVPFEGPGSIVRWARSNGHALSTTELYKGGGLPDLRDFDRLVIMGGPMNVNEEDGFSWLAKEKKFIREVIGAGKSVVGICLGAQLIADVLGAAVYSGPHTEIGWFPVELTDEAATSGLFPSAPPNPTVFHWHGDTFDLPEGAVHLARSEGCENQAFLYDGRVLGLQFHLESTPKSVADIVRNSANSAGGIEEGRFVNSAETMLAAGPDMYERINGMMERVMEGLP